MRRVIFFVFGVMMVVSVYAETSERQVRRIVLEREWNCSKDRAEAIIDMFIFQMQTDMNQLFTWAFVGTENQGDTKGKDAVSLKYTGNSYDPETRTSVVYTTIEVLGVPWFKNREIGSVYRDSTVNKTRYARIDITYSGSLLQAADGQFHTTATDARHTHVHFELNVTLGRFFSAFVTNKMWNDVAAWRIETMVDNIGEFAETGTVLPKKQD